MSNQLSIEVSSNILLLKDKGSMLYDDLANEDHGSRKRQYQIIKAMQKNIEDQINIGCFELPKHLVCSYLIQKMRDRKVSQGALDYVRECLSPEFKNAKYDGSNNRSYGGGSGTGTGTGGMENHANDNQSPTSLPYMEQIGEEFLSDSEISKLNSAEKQVYFLTIKEKATNLKKKLNDQITRNEEQAEKYHIPLENKVSAAKPPEWFWGQSETLETLENWTKKAYVLYKYLQDATELCKKFKPTGEVDRIAAAGFRKYMENEFNNESRLTIYAIEKLKQQWVKVVDEKNRETMQGWIGIGIDKFENFGSHAAGVLNAVDTGESRLKFGKDGQLYSVPLERPFSKEVVGDNTSGKLLVEARDVLRGCYAEQAINKWTKETQCEVVITDPTEYMRKKLNNPNIQVIGGPQK